MNCWYHLYNISVQKQLAKFKLDQTMVYTFLYFMLKSENFINTTVVYSGTFYGCECLWIYLSNDIDEGTQYWVNMYGEMKVRKSCMSV